MIDTSDLEWFMRFRLDPDMILGDLNELIGRLCNVNDYSAGVTERDHIIVTFDGELGLRVEGIRDADMPEAMRIISIYNRGISLVEIEHPALHRKFYKHFDMNDGGKMLAIYFDEVINTANPQMIWDAWKSESGFNEFVNEVYCDD